MTEDRPWGDRQAADDERLGRIFKAYDIRGTVPDQLDGDLAGRIGNAFAQLVSPGGDGPAGIAGMVVGHDMRPSSPGLAAAFVEGATAAGADVTAVGLVSTDELYFASGRLGVPGAMFTASHNPAEYNGIKLCRAHAAPVGADSGLTDLRGMVAAGTWRQSEQPGRAREWDPLEEYGEHLRTLARVVGRRLTVVVDAGNGMAGHTAPAVLGPLDLEVHPLFWELDGTFPNHEANPIDPANLRDLQAEVRRTRADVGLAFDGDADRCFLVDERGELVDPSALTALIAARELEREPGAAIVHNVITSRTVPQVINEHGGSAVRTRVGHSYIKAVMAETGAIFGGEHSGHYYFREFWRADSGMLAALHALAALAESSGTLSELLSEFDRLVSSGEINSTVGDQGAVLRRLEETFANEPDVAFDHLDGLTVSARDWWFNVRASNTEPLLRLNVEGTDRATMTEIRDKVLEMIRRDP